MELASVSEWCPRERIAFLHAIINIKRHFLFGFVFGCVFVGCALFSHNSFLLEFLVVIFLFFCFNIISKELTKDDVNHLL